MTPTPRPLGPQALPAGLPVGRLAAAGVRTLPQLVELAALLGRPLSQLVADLSTPIRRDTPR